ncbi:MAG: YncE family protein [Lutibacter sp.]
MKHSFLTSTLMIAIMLLLFSIMMSSCNNNEAAKLFVANEDGGSISVIDLTDSTNNTTIDLSDNSDMFMAHNVQVSPNGLTVLATANPMDSTKESELIAIDAMTYSITKRIKLGKGLELNHVVFDSASKNAFVAESKQNQVIQINTETGNVVRKFDLGKENAPHGLRYGNGKLYVANMAKSMSIIEIASGKINEIPLGGMAVQTAVTLDGKFVLVTLYDTKEVIRFDIQSQQLTRIPLPDGSQGPIQSYSTPNSKLLFVADQGFLLNRPVSDKVFVIDIASAKVIATIKVGNKPHGVVISHDGKAVYVTNQQDNTVSLIDVATQKETGKYPVGKSPNGLSYWFKLGGMQ